MQESFWWFTEVWHTKLEIMCSCYRKGSQYSFKLDISLFYVKMIFKQNFLGDTDEKNYDLSPCMSLKCIHMHCTDKTITNKTSDSNLYFHSGQLCPQSFYDTKSPFASPTKGKLSQPPCEQKLESDEWVDKFHSHAKSASKASSLFHCCFWSAHTQ